MSILSKKDETVLSTLFDPEAAADLGQLIDPTVPSYPQNSDEQLLRSLRAQERDIILSVETAINGQKGSRAAYDDQLQRSLFDAIRGFDSMIEEHPWYASAYVNRAQCTRYEASYTLRAIDILHHTPTLSDLSTAIGLVSPDRPGKLVSSEVAKLLSSAYTQRATLYLAAARQLGEEQMSGPGSILANININPEIDRLETLASRDFFQGGRYGNDLAGAMGVRVNPYAKACGNIVKEALKQEMNKA